MIKISPTNHRVLDGNIYRYGAEIVSRFERKQVKAQLLKAGYDISKENKAHIQRHLRKPEL